MRKTIFLICAILLVTVVPALAQDVGLKDKASLEKVFPDKAPYSPYAGRNLPTRPLGGETQLHTGFSMDAGAAGCRLNRKENGAPPRNKADRPDHHALA